MKANNSNSNNNNSKSARKNKNTVLASLEWYQDFVRHVELRDIAPRTRVSYLAWVRRLHEALPERDITTLAEGDVLDFLIALRHQRGLKDSTVNQAACALRGFYRDHLGREWKAWSKIKIRREEQLPNVLSRRHGKRPVTCHTLRHCFATHLLDAGVSVRLVSQYLGHASLKPTLVYLHLTEVSESAAREVMAKFPGLRPRPHGSMPLELEEVLRDHWPDFVRRHATRLAAAHHRAARAVMSCRTPELGGHVWQCSCHHHHTHYSYHSCNHRSCPRCGSLDQQKWAAVQEARLLPGVPYFLVTLTVPASLRGLCKLAPAVLYDLLLREAAGALKDLCRTKLGGIPGFTTVLHTWGRQMQHHPHVHVVIPGVVLDPQGKLLAASTTHRCFPSCKASPNSWVALRGLRPGR